MNKLLTVLTILVILFTGSVGTVQAQGSGSGQVSFLENFRNAIFSLFSNPASISSPSTNVLSAEALADLVIDSINGYSAYGLPQLSVTVKNIGSTTAYFNRRFRFSITTKDREGKDIGQPRAMTLDSWDSIGPGQTKTFNYSGGSLVDAASVVVRIDTDNAVSESNESNNEKSQAIAIPKPDLVIASVEPRADYGTEQFSVKVKNQGSAQANFNNRFQFSVTARDSQGNVIGEPRVTTLPYSNWNTIEPGETKAFTSAGGYPETASSVTFKVDTNNAVSESNEGNNEKSVNMADMPKPDLVIDSITPLNVNGIEQFSVKVKNIGSAQANFNNRFQFSATTKDNQGNTSEAITQTLSSWDTINPNQTKAFTSSSGSFKNAETIVFKVDTANVVSESNEGNNEKSLTLTPSTTPILSPSPSASASGSLLTYPIAELGNCQSKEDCARYCDIGENFNACNEYAVKMGLRTREEAERLRNARNVKSGPGGCNSQESCATFCDKPENLNVCLDYAEKHNLMGADELDKTKKVLKVISSGAKTPGNCKTPKACQQYCTGDGPHIKECIEFAKGSGLMSEEEAKEMEKGRDFLKNGGPGGCKSREECEAYCEDDSHQGECEAFFKNAGVPDAKSGDRSGKPPKTGGGAVCTTLEECKAFCKNPANAEACKNVVIKDNGSSGPETGGDIGALLSNINQMPQESKECIKQAIGAESFDKLMRGEMPTTPVTGDIMQSCFAKGVEEYEQKAMPTKKPDDFSTEYGSGPSNQANPEGAPEVQGVSVKPSLLDKILDLFRR